MVRNSKDRKSPFLQEAQLDIELDTILARSAAGEAISSPFETVSKLKPVALQAQLSEKNHTDALEVRDHDIEIEAASLIADNADSDDSDWCTESDSDGDSFDSFLFNDDDAIAFKQSCGSRFVLSGWSGKCLQETEDIDFDLVYALHNFVATVEGQANAAKGDTMVLLDDSNSYWWLVRVVKDATIGYLPAEHIETPTERLARLNKHRNIDVRQILMVQQHYRASLTLTGNQNAFRRFT